MAEAPEPTKDQGIQAGPVPGSISEAIPSPPSPEVFASAGRDAEQVYRPLSVLALVSLGLASLFAVVMVVGGAVALTSRQPFLLPAWWWLVPAALILVGWVARNQIESSEGARSGLGLARWAIGLSLVIGLLYGAYYTATYFAVTRQARAFATRWLEHIRDGELEEAYWQGNPPPRTSQPDLRGSLEIVHNSELNLEGKGRYTLFTQSNYVRMLQNAGDQAKIEFAGVNNWTYEGKGYRLDLGFRIHTPVASYDTVVAVKGTTGANFKGRQWQILRDESGATNQMDWYAFTDEGKQLNSVIQAARMRGQQWLNEQVMQGSGDVKLLPVDDKVFWVPPTETREAVIRAVGKAFDREAPSLKRYSLAHSIFPLVEREGETTHLGFDLRLEVAQEDKSRPIYLVDAYLRIDARGNDLEVVGIELIRARTQGSDEPRLPG